MENKRLNAISDEITHYGEFDIELIRDGKNGPEVVMKREIRNLIVNTGKRQLWRIATGLNSSKVFDHFRIGTSGAAAASNQTNLLSPITGTLKTANSITLLSGTRTIQLVYSYPSGAGSKSAGVEEVVILNEHTSPGGSALARAVFAAVPKTTADKLKITYRARVT